MSKYDKGPIRPVLTEEARRYNRGEPAKIAHYPVGRTVIRPREVGEPDSDTRQEAEVISLSQYRRRGWLARILEAQRKIYFPER